MVDVFHGMFAANTASGAQVITGVGFSGKVILFYSVQQTNRNVSYSGHYRYSIGMANHSGVCRAVSMASSDIVTNSDIGNYHSESGCIAFCTASGTIGQQANISGVGGDGFTLRWVNQLGGFAISGWIGFDVFGGDDVVDQKIITMRSQSGHGSETVSGVGFSGTVAIAMATNTSGGVNAARLHGYLSLGMATSSTQRAVVSVMSEDAQNTSDTWRWPRTDRFFGRMDSAGTVVSQVDFTNFHSDGITLNWISGDRHSNLGTSLLVMKISGNQKVVSWNTETGTGNQDITGVGFSGKYVFLMSNDTACNNVSLASGNNRLSIGSARDADNEGAVWAGDADAAATMVNTRGTTDSGCFLAAIENTTDSSTSGVMIAQFTSFNGDGFSINKSVNAFNGDTSGMTISSLVIGDTISGAAPEVTPEDTRRQAFAGGNYPSPMIISTSPFPAQMPAYSESRPIFGPMRDFGQSQVSGQLTY